MEKSAIEIIDCKTTIEETKEHYTHLSRQMVLFIRSLWIVMLGLSLISFIKYERFGGLAFLMLAVFFFALNYGFKKQTLSGAFKNLEYFDGWNCKLHVYDDYIEYIVERDGVIRRLTRIMPDEIEAADELKSVYVFCHCGLSFSISKSKMPADSHLYGILFPSGTPKKSVNKDNPVAFNIFFVIGFVLILIAKRVLTFTPWLAIPYAVVMVAMVVSIIVYKCKGGKVKSTHIFCCIVMSVALLVVPVSVFIAGMDMNTDTAPEVFDKIYSQMNISMPQSGEYYSWTETVYDEGDKAFVDLTYDSIDLDEEGMAALSAVVAGSDKWVGSFDDEMAAYFGAFFYIRQGDAFLVYNVTEGTYNSLPETTDPCEYIIIRFCPAYYYVEIAQFVK